ELLVVGGGGVDAELATQSCPRGVVALGVDAPAVAVLAVARPGDGEHAGGMHRDGRRGLVAGGGTVDEEIPAPRASGSVIALAEDTQMISVLVAARPDDDKIAVGVHRDSRVLLVAGGGAVDAKLATPRGSGDVEALSVDAPAIAVLVVAGPGDHE